jgi:hypothetical protein
MRPAGLHILRKCACAFEREFGFVSGSPQEPPIVAPRPEGGPAARVRRRDGAHAQTYADAWSVCHLTRQARRPCFPQGLGPGPMVGQGLA